MYNHHHDTQKNEGNCDTSNAKEIEKGVFLCSYGHSPHEENTHTEASQENLSSLNTKEETWLGTALAIAGGTLYWGIWKIILSPYDLYRYLKKKIKKQR